MRESARRHVEILDAEAVAARLQRKPLSSLKDVAGRGVRLNQLDLKVVVFSFFLGVLERVGREVGPHVVGSVSGSVRANASNNSVPLAQRIVLAEQYRLRGQ